MAHNFQLTTSPHGVLTACFNTPGKSVNTFTPDALAELDQLIASIERGERSIRGLIFTSGKTDSFITGADLFAMSTMDEPALKAFLELGQRLFERIGKLSIPTVAALNGHTLGGGFELALACTWRVAADVGSINIGLPETKLGILPAWGGTTRVTEMIGPMHTLPMLAAGKTLAPRKALSAGLIDEVVRPEALDHAAHRLVLTSKTSKRPPFVVRQVMRFAWLRDKVAAKAKRETLKKTYGHYPAAEALIDVVMTVCREGHQAGLEAERSAALKLAGTDVCRNLMRLFFLRHDAKRTIRAAIKSDPVHLDHAAVIGGGVMGAGIVHALVRAGLRVRLIEVSPEAVGAALKRISDMITTDVRAKRLSPLEGKATMRRVAPCTDWTGLNLVDFVVEAVAEHMNVKREVFGKLDKLTRPDAVLASNTSSLSITEMAAGTHDPSRVIGLHFFNPVPVMPLVEVVRTPHSCDRALSVGVETALRMGKTPVLINDAPGFLVNRVLIPYLAEAIVMAGEGADIGRVDEAMKRWGMPMGPYELLDQVGLDVAISILKSMSGRLTETVAVPAGVEKIIEAAYLGRKSNIGFYDYRQRGEPRVNGKLLDLIRFAPAADVPTDDDAIQWRLLVPMINETARLLHDGIVDRVDTIDLASVLGLGLAPFRGGLAHFIDATGLDVITAHMDRLAQRLGSRFEPTPELRDLLDAGKHLSDLKPGPRSTQRMEAQRITYGHKEV
ncbi:MAG: hypothetical protein GC162_18125 [Planctomycetes bacterium]|nr:hypothetical protein [Planctomycetota bacterium]